MRRTQGFTLIELLVVVAIVGILAVVAIPKLLSAIDKAKIGVAKSDIASINSALQLYLTDNPSQEFPRASAAFITTSLASLKPTYLAQFPKAPFATAANGAEDYKYESDGADYTLQCVLTKPVKTTIMYILSVGRFTSSPYDAGITP